MYAHVQTATSAPSASTAAEEQAIRNSLARISVQDPRTGKTRIWRMSQPVKIWSQSAGKWCPGEISYITQDADGYCLDVRYWAKPQLPKAKYLAPLSECLRAIGIQFVCRDEWTQGSNVECFSNSQKLWYKATVVDVFPDDKEDWLKIQWSPLDLSSASKHANDETPTSSTNSEQPKVMSKEVRRSSIWIRHRYPSFRHDAAPEIETSAHQRSKDMVRQILHQQQRDAEYSQPQSTAIRKFELQQPQTQAQPTFTWSIPTSQLQEMKQALFQKYFESNKFSVFGVEFYLRVVPNGKREQGNVNLYLMLSRLLSNMKQLDLVFALQCVETNTHFAGNKNFTKPGNIGWVDGALATAALQKCASLTFTATLQLGGIYDHNNVDHTDALLSKYAASPTSNNNDDDEDDHKSEFACYEWNIGEANNMLQKMKSAAVRNSFASPIFKAFGFRWCLSVYPNGDRETGYVSLLLHLVSLPPTLKHVQVWRDLKCLQTKTSKQDTDTFEKADGRGHSKFMKSASSASLFFSKWSASIDSLSLWSFAVDLKLTEVVDAGGKNVTNAILELPERKRRAAPIALLLRPCGLAHFAVKFEAEGLDDASLWTREYLSDATLKSIDMKAGDVSKFRKFQDWNNHLHCKRLFEELSDIRGIECFKLDF